MSAVIAVDIGGTSVRAAAYIGDSTTALAHARMETRGEPGSLFDRIVALVRSIIGSERIRAIGVAAPGPLSPHEGLIIKTPNIPEWEDFPLGQKLASALGVEVFMDNDANLAGLAEWKYGAGRGHHDLLHITVGTGVGSGLVLNDRLHQGYHGLASEFGHMAVDPAGPMCACGHAGHIEAFSSGTAIAAYVVEQLVAGTPSKLAAAPAITARQVATAASEGDLLAQQAFDRAGAYLGIGIANCLMLLNPSIVVLGGGVAKAGDLLLKPLARTARESVMHSRFLDDVVITRGTLHDDAGLLGALELARSTLRLH